MNHTEQIEHIERFLIREIDDEPSRSEPIAMCVERLILEAQDTKRRRIDADEEIEELEYENGNLASQIEEYESEIESLRDQMEGVISLKDAAHQLYEALSDAHGVVYGDPYLKQPLLDKIRTAFADYNDLPPQFRKSEEQEIDYE